MDRRAYLILQQISAERSLKSVGNDRTERLTARTAKEATLIVVSASDRRDIFLCRFTTPFALMTAIHTNDGKRPTKLMTAHVDIQV